MVIDSQNAMMISTCDFKRAKSSVPWKVTRHKSREVCGGCCRSMKNDLQNSEGIIFQIFVHVFHV